MCQALEILPLWGNSVSYMLDCKRNTVAIAFTAFLDAATKLVIRRENAEAEGCVKYNDQVETQVFQLSQRIEEYVSNPIVNDGIEIQISVVLELSAQKRFA